MIQELCFLPSPHNCPDLDLPPRTTACPSLSRAGEQHRCGCILGCLYLLGQNNNYNKVKCGVTEAWRLCKRAMEGSEATSRNVALKVKGKRLLPSDLWWSLGRRMMKQEKYSSFAKDRISPIPHICIGRNKTRRMGGGGGGGWRVGRWTKINMEQLADYFYLYKWNKHRDYCFCWIFSAILHQYR